MSIAQIHTLPEPIRTLVEAARRTGEPVHIVEDGAIIARLIPNPSPGEARTISASDEDRLAEEIGTEWPDGVSAVNAIQEDRSRLDEDPATRRARTLAALEQLKQVGREITSTWPKEVSALDAVRDGRREL